MNVRTVAVAILRFVGLVALGAAFVAVLSIIAGALLGASLRRAVTLGLYAVGSFVLLGGFFIGNRGPVRGAATTILVAPTANLLRRRWATAREQEESINLSALFVVFGLALIAIGIVLDSDSDLI
jgi:hypothetical protein